MTTEAKFISDTLFYRTFDQQVKKRGRRPTLKEMCEALGVEKIYRQHQDLLISEEQALSMDTAKLASQQRQAVIQR